jgi:hypothetical protein
MKDMLEHLATLREQIVKCEQLRDAAKSVMKRVVADALAASPNDRQLTLQSALR